MSREHLMQKHKKTAKEIIAYKLRYLFYPKTFSRLFRLNQDVLPTIPFKSRRSPDSSV